MLNKRSRRKPSSVRRITPTGPKTEGYEDLVKNISVTPDKPSEPELLSYNYTFSSYSRTMHKGAIYGIWFCQPVKGYERYFCAVGGNQSTVYECLENGSLNLVSVFLDPDEEEELYTVDWGVDVLTNAPIFAMAGVSGRITIVNCISKNVHIALSGHGNAVNELTFHRRDPCILFSASRDESIRMWNIQTGACIALFGGQNGHVDQIIGLDVHIDNTFLVSSGMDNEIKLWDLENPKVLEAKENSFCTTQYDDRPFPTVFVDSPVFSRRVHNDYVDAVCFVGDYILSKSTANEAILWKPLNPRVSNEAIQLRTFETPNTDIWFLKFALDCQFRVFALGNTAGKVFVWDLEGELLCELSHSQCRSTVRQTCFSLDGKTLVFGCDDGTVWRWDMTP